MAYKHRGESIRKENGFYGHSESYPSTNGKGSDTNINNISGIEPTTAESRGKVSLRI